MPSTLDAAARILVVDDDEAHAASVNHLLAAAGYEVDREHDGRRGVERIRRSGFDVLILDLNMPGLSGTQVLEELGEDAGLVKTIVLSGESAAREVAPILRLGAYDYLPKPYEPEQLLRSVRNAVARVRLEREHAEMTAAKAADDRRYAFLVNASPDLIYMLDRTGCFSFHNERLRSVLGTAPSALGRHWSDVLPDPTRARLAHRFDERRTGERATRHFEFVIEDGRGARVLELSALGIYEGGAPAVDRFAGTYGVVRDVTGARAAARALAQSQQKFEALFVNSPDAVFISALDDGRVLEGNENFVEMMRLLGTDRVENDLSVWGDPGERSAFRERLRLAPDRCTGEIVRRAGGAERHFEITARLLELDGRTCIVASLRDETSQRLAEQDRLNLETQLQQASKMEAIGQLAGGIAHDFNNILASIIGYSELALSSPTVCADATVHGYLTEVVTAGQRARDLISQMLTFTRARRGSPNATDVRRCIEDVARMLRAAIPKTIDIRNEFEDVPAVLVDPVQLQQVVINLLINSRDAITGNGRITVGVRHAHAATRCAACDADLAGDFVELSVADSGHGIPDDMRPRIFDMFVSTREPGRGTGIGLWLVSTIVHEYGGHLGLETGPRGTTFRVFLPPSGSAAEPLHPTRDLRARPSLQGHVVVVDDEVTVGNFIGEALRNAGYEAIVFNDPIAAVAHVERRPDEVLLLLTDQAMPQLSGLDVAESAKARVPGLPVVIVTGFADTADKSRMARIGVDRLLAKPFRIDALLEAVRDLTVPRRTVVQ